MVSAVSATPCLPPTKILNDDEGELLQLDDDELELLLLLDDTAVSATPCLPPTKLDTERSYTIHIHTLMEYCAGHYL
jgi:hypothetical protein